MNRRLNGWQRLWIVISVLYVALVAALGYAFWPIYETTWHRDEFIARMREAARKHVNAVYSSESEADRQEKGKRFVPDGRRQLLPNGAVLVVSGGGANELDAVLAYSDVIDAEVKAQRWATARTFVLLAVLPCVVLYALGWAVGWVYRGFKPST